MTLQRSIKAEETRCRILEVAGEEMMRVGYRSMGLNDVLKKLCMSKGALYHHFHNKLELGYAVLDELYAKRFLNTWVLPLDQENPLRATIDALQCLAGDMGTESLKCGCPMNTLASEMSAIDEGFRLRIEKVFTRWKARLTEAFTRAQGKGYMRDDVDAEDTAVFVIVAIQGALTVAKNAQDKKIFVQAAQSVSNYLSSMQTQVTAE
jgi:AcrR family transcriptional regulator